MHPQHGQGRTHFMGGVGNETPLTAHHLLDLRQYTVEGCLHGLKLRRERHHLQGFQ
ncbi:hypothetical protein D3C84_1188480 [compost metagenome]